MCLFVCVCLYLCLCLCEKTSTCVLLDWEVKDQTLDSPKTQSFLLGPRKSLCPQEKLRRQAPPPVRPSPIHGKNPTGFTGREMKGFGPEGVNCFPPGGGGAFDRRQMYEIIKVPFSSCHCAAGSKRGPRHHVMKLALAAKQVSIRMAAGGQEPPWPLARSRWEGTGTGAYSAAAL